MKPLLEKVTNNRGSSFFIKKYDYPDLCEMPYWHVHPEYEIVYIRNGSGKRHIGNHVSEYDNGDLIFMGPNLPHSAFSNTAHPDNFEIVLQMGALFPNESLLGLPENYPISQLFEKSKQGMCFFGETKERMGDCLLRMVQLNPFDRLLELLRMLREMSNSNEYELLGHQPIIRIKGADYGRIERIYNYVESNYATNISSRHLATYLNLSESAFCRVFKKHTEKTFIQFLTEFRVDRACQLLKQKRLNISQIAFNCGFQSHAHFDKQFKKVVGKTPKDYRKIYEMVVAPK